MRCLLLVLILCNNSVIEIIAQKGQTSKIISQYSFITEWASQPVKCRQILKVNLVENDTDEFVSIQFAANIGGNGYVYCSDKNELNSFIADLNDAISKIHVDSCSIVKKKYRISIEKRKLSRKEILQKIVLYEIENPKSYIVLNVDEVNDLLKYLKSINF
jgi:hypothetical protein